MKIKVGDIVKVKNWGNSWNTDTNWFMEHQEIKPEWMINYKYGDWEKFDKYYETDNNDEEAYEVLYIDSVGERVLIRPYDEDVKEWDKRIGFHTPTYLLGLKSIKLCDEPVEMTVSEIEEKLGIRTLKIIGED